MHYLIRLFVQRLALGFLTLFVVSLVIFLSIELLPGDVAQQVLGQSATPENLAAFRSELGLDQRAYTRYLAWLDGFLQGDLGNSLISGLPIEDLISERMHNTFFLAGFAALISVPLAVFLGVIAALYRETFLDKSINVSTLTAISVPEFFVGYILVWLFAVELGMFPSIANLSEGASLADRIYRTFLPALTLTLIVTAHMMRMTRASLINLLALPFIEMAQLKGASQRRLIVIHALPNAIAPIITVIAINLAYLFVYPGMGQLLVDSVAKRDFTVVLTACLLFAATYILFNLASDLISIASNPRLLHRK